jgi:hypothetical protein
MERRREDVDERDRLRPDEDVPVVDALGPVPDGLVRHPDDPCRGCHPDRIVDEVQDRSGHSGGNHAT